MKTAKVHKIQFSLGSAHFKYEYPKSIYSLITYSTVGYFIFCVFFFFQALHRVYSFVLYTNLQ